MKKWTIEHRLKSKVDVNQIIEILLGNRGIKTKKAIKEFLLPDLSQITSKALNLDSGEIKKAIERIKKAIKTKESIVVYTDYDADGICSGAIIWETLHNLGASVMPYVPHRIDEGYGLSQKGIKTVKKKYQASLIVTVDHGVSANTQVEYAKKEGIDVIVLDHHVLPKKAAKPYALVHTTELAASGLAWYFGKLLFSKIAKLKNKKRGDLINKQHLSLAAIGTIADLVPLKSANRTIVKLGLAWLNKTKRIGMKALINSSGLSKGEIGFYEVGHMIAPRINAAGRMTHALDALRLICTKDLSRAENIAKSLNITNRERQVITFQATDHARTSLEKILDKKEKNKLIFVSHKSYQQGIIGLVAGRLVDHFYRPAIVVSEGVQFSKASARSIRGFNIVAAIRKASSYLVDVGGHPMAAGFTVKTDKLDLLKQKLTQIVDSDLNDSVLIPEIKIDLNLDLSLIDYNLYQALQKLTPFGVGNPEPTFISTGVNVVDIALVGRDKKHLKLKLASSDEKVSIEAIGFGLAEFYQELLSERKIDTVYTISENIWKQQKSLQLKIKDIKISKNKGMLSKSMG